MNEREKSRYMGVMLAIACFALLPAQAGLNFNIGVTPHGSSLSVGYHAPARRGVQLHGSARVYSHPPRGCAHPYPPAVRYAPPHGYAHPAPPVVRYTPPRGHYVVRVERHWVDGCWSESISHYGRVVRVWNPGYWAERSVRVWVNY